MEEGIGRRSSKWRPFARATAGLEMVKRRTLKEDVRYMTYYELSGPRPETSRCEPRYGRRDRRRIASELV